MVKVLIASQMIDRQFKDKLMKEIEEIFHLIGSLLEIFSLGLLSLKEI